MTSIDVFRPEGLIDAARLAWGASAFLKLLVEQVKKIFFLNLITLWCYIAFILELGDLYGSTGKVTSK